MAHRSDITHKLTVENHKIAFINEIKQYELSDVVMFVLPPNGLHQSPLENVKNIIGDVAKRLPKNSTLIVIGETIDLVSVESSLKDLLTYQLWIAIKTQTTNSTPENLPHNHFDALVYTNYKTSLKHTKTRIAYTYCPACELTTKDYGGKKHTYDPYGTMVSDVWKDIPSRINGDLTGIFNRFADLFSIEEYRLMSIFDCRQINWQRENFQVDAFEQTENQLPIDLNNKLLKGDCLENLRRIPDNSIDFAFADPPYNLSKKYSGYADDLEIQRYFDWCDEWLEEMYRVLKPGRTLAVLNIPLYAVRHFHFLKQKMIFQNWIVWDALSYPVRLIMPAHYTILIFSKGDSRPLPLGNNNSQFLSHLIEDYCIREKCIIKRHKNGVHDTESLTDMWADTHRLKHNSRRVDHPCQLPPKLMCRLIDLYSKEGEFVLDPFDGSGTTTLTAHLMKRNYIGMELNETYHELASSRHKEIDDGINPFRKVERALTAKNSPVERMKKQKYLVPKKTLQLEVKRVAGILGHIPNRDELVQYGTYPINYYDEYFLSWGEVTAAARTKGMSEKREKTQLVESEPIGQLIL